MLEKLQGAPVTQLRGVGPRVAEKLKRLNIESVRDLLFHFPSRYQDRSSICPMHRLFHGLECLVLGQVRDVKVVMGRRRSLLVALDDGQGMIVVRFFYFNRAQQQQFRKDQWVRCFGEIRSGARGWEMVHPEYRIFPGRPAMVTEKTLTAVYGTTEGISQKLLRNIVEQGLEILGNRESDWLTDDQLRALEFPALVDSIVFLHRPPPDVSIESLQAGDHAAVRRLSFEELLAHHLSMRRIKRRRLRQKAPPIPTDQTNLDAFKQQLEFTLTTAQERVCEELFNDMNSGCPMYRLLQGDVGCGKTVVAAAAALMAIGQGFQVAIMAPTELLAEQHFRNFSRWFSPLGFQTGWLTSRLKAKQRQDVIDQLANRQLPLVIGTHAIFQEDVEIPGLALVIIDEQHRFGVDQRMALLNKGIRGQVQPHQLSMTATPIPRSLAMTFYADLDVSSIDELPPGRTPVETVALPDVRRDEVIDRVADACTNGRQVYWVCPTIDESEILQTQAVNDTADLLKRQLQDVRIGVIHGRMKTVDKDAVMQEFHEGAITLLVATTVIEVGVDVPNASLMIIENAERLGLAQLHQLRGRVGRGPCRSCCVLMYRTPLGEVAKNRIAAMRHTNDGFEIAQRDLEQRGPGEMLGKRQTGLQSFRVAELVRDRAMIPMVEKFASRLIRQQPDQAAACIRCWIHFREDYAEV